VSVNGSLVEDKIRRFKGECAHFSFNKCPIFAHDSASAKFRTISSETDNNVPVPFALVTIIKNLSEFTGTKLFGSQHMHKKNRVQCSVVQETVNIYLKESF
jgi:hypothetical protein